MKKKKNIIKNKKKGILFWITGLSGSGKSSIAEKIKTKIEKKYGPTILASGDDLRSVINFHQYSKKKRLEFSKVKMRFYKFITDQNINLIFTTISMFKKVREENIKNIDNYVEIFINADVKEIIKQKKKLLYSKKNEMIWGVNIKPEFPNNPDIEIKNNFRRSTNKLSQELLEKIYKIV